MAGAKHLLVVLAFVFSLCFGFQINTAGHHEVSSLELTYDPTGPREATPKVYVDNGLDALRAEIAALNATIQEHESLYGSMVKVHSFVVDSPTSELYTIPMDLTDQMIVLATVVHATELAAVSIIRNGATAQAWTRSHDDLDLVADQINIVVLDPSSIKDSRFDVFDITTTKASCLNMNVGPFEGVALSILTPYSATKDVTSGMTIRSGYTGTSSKVICILAWDGSCIATVSNAYMLAIDSAASFNKNVFQFGSTSTGTVTFSKAFAEPPTVIVTVAENNNAGKTGIVLRSVSETGFTFTAHHCAGFGVEDSDFHWIAVAQGTNYLL